MPNPSVFDIRRANLRALIAQHDGPTNLARRLGLAGPSYLSQIVSGHRNLQEKTARKWEELLGLQVGALDIAGAAQPVDIDLAVAIMHTVGRIAEDERKMLRPAQFAQIVELVWEDARAKGAADENFVRRLVHLAR